MGVFSFQHYARSLKDYAHVLGLRGSLQWLAFRGRRQFDISPQQSLVIHPRLLKHPIRMRAGGSSDLDVFEQIIMGTEYEPLNDLQPLFIIDLGANIGLSSAWFLSRFPRAELLAVEPDIGNYSLCCENLAHYGRRARVLLGAAWSKRTKLLVSHAFGDHREWASRVQDGPSDAEEVKVDAWDILSLIRMSNAHAVDLLKIDIERAELEVFAAGCEDWLPLVRNICIELHDEECKNVFFKALGNYDFSLADSGEITICRNVRPKSK